MHCVLPTANGVRVGGRASPLGYVRRPLPRMAERMRPTSHAFGSHLPPTCLTSRSAQSLSLESVTNSDIF